ncbi:MAG: ribonuclease Z [Nanoarchaeota archaeon]
MKITFLGTGSMQPTKERNLSAALISYRNESILVDCGEGTQRQMKIAGLKPTKITKILISHWHGDHVIGLMGLIQYLKANEYNKTLEVYGPIETKKYFNRMVNSFIFKHDLDIKITEISKDKIFFVGKDFSLVAYRLNHSVPCLGYSIVEDEKRKINLKYLKKFGLKQHPILGRLQRGEDIVWNGKKIKAKDATIIKKGTKVSFIADTAYCNNCLKLAKDSDLLICESTYLNELEKKAEEYKHLTPREAATIAKKTNVKRLILTHFSQRYKEEDELKKEAKKMFSNVECARDFMEVEI